jgi:hypothetical protein
MKRLALILLMCLPALMQAQTFSNRANDDLFSAYVSILNQPFGYQTIGVRIDTNEMYHFNTVIRNFNFNGEVIDTKEYYFPNRIFHPSRDNNARLNDSTTVTVMRESIIGNDTLFATVVWLTNEGDTLRTKRFDSPYFISGNISTNLNVPTCIICSPDGQYIYFVSQIFHSSSQNNFMIKKINAWGDEIWTYLNPLGNGAGCNSIAFYNNQIWFVVVSNSTLVIGLNDSSGEAQTIEIITPQNINYSNDLEMDGNKFVIATMDISSPGYSIPVTYKCTSEGEEIFRSSPAGANFDFMQLNDHIVKSQNDGYVACSVKFEEQSNPFDPNETSSNNTNKKIWLWKVDSLGIFQWQRFYEYLSFDSGYFFLNNTANDLKSTPDGGYIMAGESTSLCINWPSCSEVTQQGWLLKVDGCGCLVPGCDQNCVVTNSENELEAHENYFLFGPNPVDELLNVYVPTLPIPIKDLTFRLFDMQGKLLREFQFESDNTTYMIDVNSLASGNYILSAFYKGEVVESEKVVKK